MTFTVKHNKKHEVNPAKADNAKRKALVESLCGSLSWVNYSVDEYLREKREEVKRENGR